MRALPLPSVGTVLGLALLGVGVMAANRARNGGSMSAAEARSASV
jgi:hypothetical protein